MNLETLAEKAEEKLKSLDEKGLRESHNNEKDNIMNAEKQDESKLTHRAAPKTTSTSEAKETTTTSTSSSSPSSTTNIEDVNLKESECNNKAKTW